MKRPRRLHHRAPIARFAAGPYLLVTLGMALLSRDAAAQTLDALIQQLALSAPDIGKKDNTRSLDRMKLGWSLWDTDEGRGGYLNMVSQMALEPPSGAYSPGESVCGSFAVLPEECFSPGTCLGDSTASGIHGATFLDDHARFALTAGASGIDDFADAYQSSVAASRLDFLVNQDSVFSPIRGTASLSCGDQSNTSYYTFGSWTNTLAPRAASLGLTLVDNIGFANHPFSGGNDFDYARLYPMVGRTVSSGAPVLGTKPVANRPILGMVLFGETGNQSLLSLGMHYPFLSMVHPQVACLLADSIKERVWALDNPAISPVAEQLAYTIVGGEFFVSLDSNELDAGQVETNECFVSQGSGILSLDDYFRELPLSDYSDASLVHFRAWLLARYQASTVGPINAAWGSTFPSISDVSPLDGIRLSSQGGQLVVTLDDWREFQREQWLITAHVFQYNAAKEESHDRAFYRLDFRSTGGELGSFYADGPASAAFYDPVFKDGEAFSPLAYTEVKREAMVAGTYGESFSLPLFGFPRTGNDPCWLGPLKPEVPFTFAPPCYNVPHSYRTMREIIALGVDSLGIAYWEAGTFLSNKAAAFPYPEENGVEMRLPEAMALLFAQHDDQRTFTTPWRSPLLVHLGRGKRPGDQVPDLNAVSMPWRVFGALVEEQIQFAPFTLRDEVFDDLWARSGRESLLSAFAADFDEELLALYLSAAADRGWGSLTVLAQQSTMNANFGPTWAQTLTTNFGLIEKPGSFGIRSFALSGQPDVLVIVYNTSPSSLTKSGAMLDIQQRLASSPEAFLGVSEPDLRPVRVVPTDGSAPLTDLDVSVSTDGLSYLIAVSNPSADTVSQPLTVTIQAAAPNGVSYAALDIPSLPRSGSVLVYVKPVIPALAGISEVQLLHAIDRAHRNLRARGNDGYDTAAAAVALGVLDELAGRGLLDKTKILAGLVRLKRMLLPKVVNTQNGWEVQVVDLSGSGVNGAEVQLEFVLQNHARRDAAPTQAFGIAPEGPTGTITPGTSLLNTTPPAVFIWDLVTQQYVLPAQNLVEVSIHGPVGQSHASTLWQVP